MTSLQFHTWTVIMVRLGFGYPEAHELASLRNLGSNLPGDLLMLAVWADYYDTLLTEDCSSSPFTFP